MRVTKIALKMITMAIWLPWLCDCHGYGIAMVIQGCHDYVIAMVLWLPSLMHCNCGNNIAMETLEMEIPAMENN